MKMFLSQVKNKFILITVPNNEMSILGDEPYYPWQCEILIQYT